MDRVEAGRRHEAAANIRLIGHDEDRKASRLQGLNGRQGLGLNIQFGRCSGRGGFAMPFDDGVEDAVAIKEDGFGHPSANWPDARRA